MGAGVDSLERASKFKGSKAEIRQGVSLLGLGIASSGNLRTFYTGVSPTHVCCSSDGLARVGWILIKS